MTDQTKVRLPQHCGPTPGIPTNQAQMTDQETDKQPSIPVELIKRILDNAKFAYRGRPGLECEHYIRVQLQVEGWEV